MTDRSMFIFGIARSGTNLISRILGLHPKISVVLDPFMPLFRSFRNASLSRCGAQFDPRAPFFDYDGRPQHAPLLEAVLGADLDIPFQDDLGALRLAVCARAALESSDLGLLSEISGETYRDLFASALRIIRSVRKKPIVAAKELWTIDFMPALARAFPDTRFVFVERDPRAIIASLRAMSETDPTQAAHAPSYLRHWRKNIHVARRLRSQFPGRTLIAKYEEIVCAPYEAVCDWCNLIGIEPDPTMLDTQTGGWRANSSYPNPAGNIASTSLERWQAILPQTTIDAIDGMCGAEMFLAGYAPQPGWQNHGPAVVEFLTMEHDKPGSWRSDGGDLVAAIATEKAYRPSNVEMIAAIGPLATQVG